MLQWLGLEQSMFQEKAEMINIALHTLSETITEKLLPFQLIYTGKTACSLPSVEFPNGFCLSYNPKHWSNEYETINLLESIVDLDFCQVREELGLQLIRKHSYFGCIQSSVN